jgi:hypothetical protein
VCAVKARGGKLVHWSFDGRQRVLQTTWIGRRGTLVARACVSS